MILGIGDGTFAVLVTVGVAIVIALFGSYVAPQSALLIILGCAMLPFIVYGCILTAPHGPITNSTTLFNAADYRERPLPSNTDLIDKFLPVRIVVFILMALGTFSGLAFHIFTLVNSPPYETPRVRCLRQQLEEAHPSWYR
ncbi:hypothetical protein CUR178_07411 [Leishmania enriettii]|uniref:Uncharacterized protein n=1 Tax=Leishmania enriettii TaxID=5663 RepID=A0A836HWP2_LEIEN|nr:hypothetical protein CUR178_07411 [Leishmania enriettii]